MEILLNAVRPVVKIVRLLAKEMHQPEHQNVAMEHELGFNMKTIIAGSRDFGHHNYDDLDIFIPVMLTKIPWTITHILSGGARGADRLGEMWAELNEIPMTQYPADWDTYGKAAGYLRNEAMAKNADALIAFWDGESRGTNHMVDLAEKYGLTIHLVRTDQPQ